MGALRAVVDPELKKDVLALGMVRDLKIEGEGVSLRLAMPTPMRPVQPAVQDAVRAALARLGARNIDIKVDNSVPQSRPAPAKKGVPGVRHIIAVTSGKGGVGKSTVSTNLACALAKLGHKVGLLDSDVYGPNIPTMMGIHDLPQAKQDPTRGELIIPLESYGVKVMSMGFLTRGDQPLVWRGPMLHSVVNQFLANVEWGELDYLVVDMPPGTGDVQLSLTQLVPVSGAVVVTTPQEVSLQDVRKAILMFEKVGVPILGIVENMSYFVCDNCDKKHDIFGTGGGKRLAEKFHTRLLAELPLAQAVREGGDAGAPIVVREPNTVQAKAFLELGKSVASELGSKAASPEIQIGEF